MSKSSSGRGRTRSFPIVISPQEVRDLTTEVKTAVEQLLSNCSSNVNTPDYEKLYRNVYTLILHGHGESLYNGLKSDMEEGLRKIRADILISLEDDFLQKLSHVWANYDTSVIMIRDIFMYMERVYVAEKNIDGVIDLGMILFRNEVIRFPAIKNKLREIILELVVQDFRGELPQFEWQDCVKNIKEVSQMLIKLGVKDNNPSIYEEIFEEPFLLKVVEFYKIEGGKYLEDNNANLYISQVEDRIRADMNRVQLLSLHESTGTKLLQIMEDELITKNILTLMEVDMGGVEDSLINRKEENFTRLQNFVGRVEGGKEKLGAYITSYLNDQADPNLPSFDGQSISWIG